MGLAPVKEKEEAAGMAAFERAWKNLSFESALCFCFDPYELLGEREQALEANSLSSIQLLLQLLRELFFLPHLLCSSSYWFRKG